MKDYKELLGKIGKDKLLLMAAAGIVLIVCSVPTEKKSSDSEHKIQQHKRKQTEIQQYKILRQDLIMSPRVVSY